MFFVALGLACVGPAGCAGGSDEQAAPDAGYNLDAPAYEVAPPIPIAAHDASLPPRTPRPSSDARADAVAGPVAVCAPGGPTVVYQEVAVGQPDFVALRNVTSQPIDLEGYTLVLAGINPMEPREHTIGAGITIAPGQVLHVFEYQKGNEPDDINTAANIPFYDGPPSAAQANAAVLYDPQQRLLDYVGIGPEATNLPIGASFNPIPWPAGFDPAVSSFQRLTTSGACPDFAASDWHIAPVTR